MLKELTSVPKIKTIEDRNNWAVRMAGNYRIPRYNWTIDEITGDITVNAFGPTLPSSVNLWHSTTCDSLRRDFRYYSLSTCQPHACKCHSKMSWNGIPLWFSVAKEKKNCLSDVVSNKLNLSSIHSDVLKKINSRSVYCCSEYFYGCYISD